MHIQETNFFPLLIGLVFMAASTGFLVYSLIRVHRNYVRELDSYDAARLIAVDEERRILALDLHDDLGPILTGARLNIKEIRLASEEDRSKQDGAIDYLFTVSQRLRHWSRKLNYPTALQQGPFCDLQEFVQSINSSYGIGITLQDFEWPSLSEEQAMHIYRMLQEIIHNAVKHADARSMVITGHVKENELVIVTLDDGVGFIVDDRERRSPGVGLHNLHVRARLLNAAFSIESAPGEGARHIIKLPL